MLCFGREKLVRVWLPSAGGRRRFSLEIHQGRPDARGDEISIVDLRGGFVIPQSIIPFLLTSLLNGKVTCQNGVGLFDAPSVKRA